jgi:hypothetical protein
MREKLPSLIPSCLFLFFLSQVVARMLPLSDSFWTTDHGSTPGGDWMASGASVSLGLCCRRSTFKHVMFGPVQPQTGGGVATIPGAFVPGQYGGGGAYGAGRDSRPPRP